MRLIKKIFWWLKAFLANLLYGFPSRQLILIGVTGTDGKTTTTSLIYHILNKLGEKTASISTVGAYIAGKTYDIGFHVTTPRFFALQKFLRQAVNNKSKYFVLEVTSHAIDQLRIWGCKFKIAVLTNITPEHLDYHKNFLNYAKTKLKLINAAETAVVNVEGPTFYRYKKLITNKNIWTTSLSKKADYQYKELERLGISDKFVGFEKENILLAYTVCRLLGFDAKATVAAINSFQRVKGRFDLQIRKNKRFLVDFAHTPYAFKSLFASIKKSLKYSRIIHVFGCAGLRDKQKRPVMGQISAQNADLIIITEEDYRTENIETIFKEIEKGIIKVKNHQKNKSYFFIPNRQEAINFACKLAGKNDLLLLTGKAHEKSLARGKKEYVWDEYKALDKAVKNIS